MPEASVLKHITSCRLCGKAIAETSNIDVPIIGGAPSAKVEQFVAVLMRHLHRSHARQADTIYAGGKSAIGLLTLLHYDVSDPALIAHAELHRAQLFVLARKNILPPDAILHRLVQLGLDPGAQEQVYRLMLDLHDLLTETGQYSTFTFGPAENPGNSPKITV